MKILIGITIFFASITSSYAQKFKQTFVSTDIDNFWTAYDKIATTKDSVIRYNFLQTLYLNKATPGLKSLIEVRNYTEKDFIDWMTKYPKFWASLRTNTQKVKSIYPKINTNIQKLKAAYPHLQSLTIYFSVGAFRTMELLTNTIF